MTLRDIFSVGRVSSVIVYLLGGLLGLLRDGETAEDVFTGGILWVVLIWTAPLLNSFDGLLGEHRTDRWHPSPSWGVALVGWIFLLLCIGMAWFTDIDFMPHSRHTRV